MEPGPLTRELFSKGHESASKFDYFVCSVAGAIFAYTAEHYVPKRFAWSFSMLEPLSLLLLAASFYCGFKRLHFAALGTQINHLINDHEEKASQLAKATGTEPNDAAINSQVRQLMVYDMKKHVAEALALDPRLDAANALAKNHYSLRDFFLMCGFACIFLAKLLQPYEADYIPPKDYIYRTMTVTPPAPHPQASQENTQLPTKGTPLFQPAQPISASSNQSTRLLSERT